MDDLDRPGNFKSWESPKTLPAPFIGSLIYTLNFFPNTEFAVIKKANEHSCHCTTFKQIDSVKVVRVLSTGGGEASSPKVLLKKRFTAISNKDLFGDDFKESVKVTNVQQCDFSQS